MRLIKHEIHVFFTALMFYTRIPCPAWVDHSEKLLNQSTRYFSFIGYIVGGISALTFLLFNYFTGTEIAVVISLAASILTTGAFHEDGFADSCDGFGGGWTKDKILVIMKDSRIGAYGVIGLILLFALKIFLLIDILQLLEYQYILIIAFFISAHSLSRFFASSLIYLLPYTRETDDSKVKPVAKSVKTPTLIFSFLIGTLPLFLAIYLTTNAWLGITVIPLIFTILLLKNYYKKWIGGYTGDCLGAAQQTLEVVFYLMISVLWKFT